MPRMDIIEAWRDGYAHGVKDAAAACVCTPKPPREDHPKAVVDIREYQARRAR